MLMSSANKSLLIELYENQFDKLATMTMHGDL